MIDETISHYCVVEKLGAGGMDDFLSIGGLARAGPFLDKNFRAFCYRKKAAGIPHGDEMHETARTDSVGDRLCIEIARATIAKVAADEVDFFDDVANARNSIPVIKDDALAFGVGGEILLLTPMLIKVVEESVRYVAPKLFATVLDIGKDTVKDAIHKKLQDHASADSARPGSQVTESFSREQLKTIHDVAMVQLAKSGLAADVAMEVASVIVGELAIA